LRRSEGERIYDRFAEGMSALDADPTKVVGFTEEALFKMQEKEHSDRRFRLIGGGLVLAAGAGVAASGLAFVHPSPGYSSHATTQTLMVGSGLLAAALGTTMILQGVLVRSPSDRLIDLWKEDPSLSKMPRLSVAPTPGGAMLTLGGAW